MATKITIDVEELVSALADDLQITDTDVELLRKTGTVPAGWTNALLDRLEHDYGLESKMVYTITEQHDE